VDTAFSEAVPAGAPAVLGEVVEGDTAGYHFYPGRDRVRAWLAEAGLQILADADDPYDGWAYWHILTRTSAM